MTRHSPDVGCASDSSCRVGNLLQAIRSTTQIWAVTRHQYGISALIALKRFIHGYSASFSVSFKHTVNPLLSSPGVIYFMQV